ANPARRERASGSMPHEVDPAELLAEAGARFDRGTKISFAQDIGLELIGGDYAGVARGAAHQRQFAEEVAGAEPGDLAARALDPDRAVGHQEQLVAHLALANDDFAWHV